MAQTFKDFITEAELFPYSTENYELLKECCELQVIAQYMESQEFIAENADLVSGKEVNGSAITFTEGYFAESAEENAIQLLEESFKEKVSNVGGKIKTGLIRLWTTFKNFIAKLVNKFDDQCRRANAIKAHMIKNGNSYSDEVLTAIGEAFRGVGETEGFKLPSTGFLPHPMKTNSAITAKIPKKVMDAVRKVAPVNNFLAAALADTYIYADVYKDEYKEDTPINADDVAEIGKLISAEKVTKDWLSITKMMTAAQNEANKNGLLISCNSEKLKKLVTTLETMINEFKAKEDFFAQRAKGDLGKDEVIPHKNKKEQGYNAYQVHNLYARFNPILANTMKVYSGFNTFRVTAIPKLEKAIAIKTKGAAEGDA